VLGQEVHQVAEELAPALQRDGQVEQEGPLLRGEPAQALAVLPNGEAGTCSPEEGLYRQVTDGSSGVLEAA
jgi:hypothetical protein